MDDVRPMTRLLLALAILISLAAAATAAPLRYQAAGHVLEQDGGRMHLRTPDGLDVEVRVTAGGTTVSLRSHDCCVEETELAGHRRYVRYAVRGGISAEAYSDGTVRYARYRGWSTSESYEGGSTTLHVHGLAPYVAPCRATPPWRGSPVLGPEEALAALSSTAWRRRVDGAVSLAAIGDLAALRPLADLSRLDPDPMVRLMSTRAALRLAAIHGRRTFVMSYLRPGKGPENRLFGALAALSLPKLSVSDLDGLRQPWLGVALEKVLGDDDPVRILDLRRFAVARRQPDPLIRTRIVERLSRQDVPILIQVLRDDPDAAVRWAALSALQAAGSPSEDVRDGALQAVAWARRKGDLQLMRCLLETVRAASRSL